MDPHNRHKLQTARSGAFLKPVLSSVLVVKESILSCHDEDNVLTVHSCRTPNSSRPGAADRLSPEVSSPECLVCVMRSVHLCTGSANLHVNDPKP